MAGLGGFFLAAAPSGGNAIPNGGQWLVASIVLLGSIAAFIVAALRGPRWWRAAAFGAATAITAAYTASLTKAITTYTTEGWGHVFTHFQPYMLAVTGLGTVFLLQNALHAGPITASRTTLVTINPLVSIVLGVTLFVGPAAIGRRMDLARGPGPGGAGGRRGHPGPLTPGGRDRTRPGTSTRCSAEPASGPSDGAGQAGPEPDRSRPCSTWPGQEGGVRGVEAVTPFGTGPAG